MSLLEMLWSHGRRQAESDMNWAPEGVYWVVVPGTQPREFGDRDEALDEFDRQTAQRRDERVRIVDPRRVPVVFAHGCGTGAKAHRSVGGKTPACAAWADRWVLTNVYMAASHGHSPCQQPQCFPGGWVS